MTEEADPRRKLLAEIGDINDFSLARPLVSLESFFLGNDDYGSIGYNFYPDQPSPSEFFELFAKIRSYSAVRDVLVQVQQHEEPDAWPSADTIWIVTDASVEEVAGWLGDRFRADELFEGIPDGVQTIDVPAGCQAIGVWYD
ncbi:MAG: hypothetical protein AAGF72_08075 [Pseudomonadota bacterium]